MKDFLIKLTEENKKEVKKYIITNTACDMSFNVIGSYYGIINNKSYYLACSSYPTVARKQELELLLINSISELQEEKTFPRYMMVSDSEKLNPVKRLVLGKFGIMYIAVNALKEKEFNEGKRYNVCSWVFAKEIEEPKVIEVTIDDIAKKFNVSPEQIKIKK